ncbi:MAG: hypothetical protein AB2708_09040 [Candidatus Thiodiazotropha taylori]
MPLKILRGIANKRVMFVRYRSLGRFASLLAPYPGRYGSMEER